MQPRSYARLNGGDRWRHLFQLPPGRAILSIARLGSGIGGLVRSTPSVAQVESRTPNLAAMISVLVVLVIVAVPVMVVAERMIGESAKARRD